MTRHLLRGACAALLTLILSAAPALAAGEAAHLTIYDAGIAEYHETRTVELQPGLNQIEWRSLMPKAYIRTVRVTAEGAEVVRQDITYDGADVRNEKSPVLHLVVRNTGATGARRIEVDYLAPGVSWQNDYTLTLEPTAAGAPPTAALLDAWVSVFNNTGTDVRGQLVDLIAGEVAFRLDGSTSSGTSRYDNVSQTSNSFSMDADELPPPPTAEVTGLSAFSRIRLGRDLVFNANAPVNRLPLFQRVRLTVMQRNVFENAYNTQTTGRGGFTLLPRGLEVRLLARNTTDVTMPAGLVTIYARDGEYAQVVGQDRIGLTPPGGDFSISQGRSATLFGTRRVLERRGIEYRDERNNTHTKMLTRIEIVITNRGASPAEAYIRDGIEPYNDNQWTILESSPQGERLGASAMQFRVQVPAGGKATVTYTVETK